MEEKPSKRDPAQVRFPITSAYDTDTDLSESSCAPSGRPYSANFDTTRLRSPLLPSFSPYTTFTTNHALSLSSRTTLFLRPSSPCNLLFPSRLACCPPSKARARTGTVGCEELPCALRTLSSSFMTSNRATDHSTLAFLTEPARGVSCQGFWSSRVWQVRELGRMCQQARCVSVIEKVVERS